MLKKLSAGCFLFLAACASTRVSQTFDVAKLREVDAAIEQAIAGKRIPGGNLWIEKEGVIYRRTYGNRALVPDVEANSLDTIYDVASLTKVVATAPSIWLLIGRGQVDLDAPVRTYLPEFTGGWRDEVTIRHLLTHFSGLPADVPQDEPWRGYEEGIRRTVLLEPTNRPGAIFRYGDSNYILLGDVVRRVAGEPLHEFALRNIFEPLGMNDTRFAPAPASRIAPTQLTDDGMLRGVVHDPKSRRMEGLAGHAGLFTTVEDLAKFARAILNGWFAGMSDVLSPEGALIRRGAGFDVESNFSRPRGGFPLGSFGHTGWTGTFLWIDPSSRTFYIFLSNRVHPFGEGSVIALQKTLGALIAQSALLPSPPPAVVRYVIGGSDARNGIDVLARDRYRPLQGMRIGLITNRSGIDRIGNRTIDLLHSAPGVNLVALFSPEHGIRGELDADVPDDRDQRTGLPIHSLYGARRKPSGEQLANLDALVFDIQDIGTRFYTYISTLGLAMEAAAEERKKIIVLDRVNPIGGSVVEGPVSEGESAFVAYHPIAIRHGMTAGELATMFRAEKNLGVELTVIPVEGWKRDEWQDEAGLPWINTSPNMRSLDAAALYPGIGLLEAAISVGRGTPTPFEILGAPYIDSERLIAELNLPGLRFEPVTFTPDASVHKGEVCRGVRMTITDRRVLRAVDAGIAIATVLYRLYPSQFDPEKMARLIRHQPTLDAIRANRPLSEIRALWNSDFLDRRAKYLLY